MMSYKSRQLFNFIQGSEITGESSFDVWKRVTGNTSEEDFLEFLRSGPVGETGPTGETGASAYEEWLAQEGNEGKTFEDFLLSLKGEQGEQGVTGKSAYEIWLAQEGNEGKTEEDFIEDISAGRPVALTQAEYDALPDSKYTDNVIYMITDGASSGSAKFVEYDNSLSKLGATNVQDAIDELKSVVSGGVEDPQQIVDHLNNNDIHVTEEEKSNWNAAESNAKTYIDTQITEEVTARDEAISTAVGAETTARETAVSEALTGAKSYTDNEIESVKSEVNAYTDEKLAAETSARETGDTNTLANANTYTDEKVDAEVTARDTAISDAVSAAKTEVNAYTDGKIIEANSYTDEKVAAELTARETGDTNTLTEAKSYTDTEIATAKTETNSYTDEKIAAEVTDRDNAISAAVSTAKTEANSYTDEKIAAEVSARETGDTNTLADAKSYTDTQIAALVDGAPETMDTLKELGELLKTSDEAVSALNESIATRAKQSDLDAHTGDAVAHVTAEERTAWNAAESNSKGYADGKIAEAIAPLAKTSDLELHTGDTVAHVTEDERTTWNSAESNAKAYTDEKITAEETARNEAIETAVSSLATTSDLNTHADNTDIHITADERLNWIAAKTHADSEHAPVEAQENVIESVKVNGSVLDIEDKAVDIPIPTKMSGFENDIIIELTKAEYDALSEEDKNKDVIYLITDGDCNGIASETIYSNETSGLTATNVQDAIDELKASIDNGLDNPQDLIDHMNNNDIHVTTEEKSNWSAAEGNAKSYTDEKIAAEVTARDTAISDSVSAAKTEVNAYTDEKVSAETTARETGDTNTLADAKSYTDEKVAALVDGAPETMDTLKELSELLKTNDEAVDALNEAIGTRAKQEDLDAHTGDNDIHITADERTAWNAVEGKANTYTDTTVADAVAPLAKSADLIAHTGDTVAHVTAEERTAWNAAESNAKAYTDEKVSAEVTARDEAIVTAVSAETSARESAISNAITDATADVNAYTDEKVAAETSARETGDTNTLTEAKGYTDTQITDAKTEVNEYTDGKISEEITARDNAITTAKTEVNEYTDGKIAAEVTARETGDSDTLTSAKSYTDEKVSALVNGAPETMDTLKELSDLLKTNDEAVDALNEAIGTRAKQEDLEAHTGDTVAHITAEERTAWNKAKTHADSEHAPVEAQENVIESVKVNGVELSVDENKSVDITIPTKLSSFENDVIVSITQEEYDTLSDEEKNSDTIYLITDGESSIDASDVGYSNETSGLTASNIQEAIDEINEKIGSGGGGSISGVSGVKGNNEDEYRTGDVNITLENVGVIELTQKEYDALSDEEKDSDNIYFITDGESDGDASSINYDNTTSGLSATNVQGVIDEVNESLNNLKSDTELDKVSVLSIEENGEYYVTNALDTPEGVSVHGHVYVSHRASEGNKVVKYIPNNDTRVFFNVYYGTWLGWEEIATNSDLEYTDIPFTATNNASFLATSFIRRRSYDNGVLYNINCTNVSGDVYSLIRIATTTVNPGYTRTFPCHIMDKQGLTKGIGIVMWYGGAIYLTAPVTVETTDTIRAGN